MMMRNRSAAFSQRGTSSVSMVPQQYQQPVYYQAPQPQPLGQLGDLSSSFAPFVFGMVAWAFFGDTIKGVLGLGSAAAGKGIAAAHKKIGSK